MRITSTTRQSVHSGRQQQQRRQLVRITLLLQVLPMGQHHRLRLKRREPTASRNANIDREEKRMNMMQTMTARVTTTMTMKTNRISWTRTTTKVLPPTLEKRQQEDRRLLQDRGR